MKAPDRNARSDCRWLSAHLFYQGSLELMLQQLVAPLTQALRNRDVLARWFFLRYWEGGPHVRLRLLPAGAADSSQIRQQVVESSLRFFAEHPSLNTLSAEAYEQAAKTMILREPDAEVSFLQANNSVRFIEYRPEHHKYGKGLSLRAVEKHFEESSDLVLRLVVGDVPVARRRALGLAAVVAAACAGGPSLDGLSQRLDLSRQFWMQASGARAPHEERTEPRPAEPSTKLRSVVSSILRRPWMTTGDTFVDGWRQSIDDLWHALTLLEAAGDFVPEKAARGALGTLPFLSATTVAIEHCAHMLCNRLGIGLREEWSLRRLASRVATELRNEAPRSPLEQGASPLGGPHEDPDGTEGLRQQP